MTHLFHERQHLFTVALGGVQAFAQLAHVGQHVLQPGRGRLQAAQMRGDLVQGHGFVILADGLHLRGRARQFALVAHARRENDGAGHADGQIGLGTHGLAVLLQIDVLAGLELGPVQHALPFVQGNDLGPGEFRQGLGRVAQVGQTAPPGLVVPDFRIAVAVEDHGAVFLNDVADKGFHGGIESRAGLDFPFQPVGGEAQGIGHHGVERGDGTGGGLAGAHGPEFKAVAGKGHGAGAVAVAGVRGQGRQGIHPHIHDPSAFAVGRVTDASGPESLKDLGELIAQKDGHDGRRGLMRAQTVIVAGAGHSGPQQAAELMHGADHGRAENQELGIGVRGFAGIKKRAQLRVADGIIDVLARAVDAAEGFFVQQAFQAVALGHVAQGGHDDVVVVHGQVAGLVERRDLVLAGGRLVVAGAHGHAQLVEFALHFHHAGQDALRNDPEILVAEFLPLGRARAEQRTPGDLQIGAGEVEVVVDEKIFLLQTGIGNHR